jgi:hypothetical protein
MTAHNYCLNAIFFHSFIFSISADASKKQEEDTLAWDDALPSGEFSFLLVFMHFYATSVQHWMSYVLWINSNI